MSTKQPIAGPPSLPEAEAADATPRNWWKEVLVSVATQSWLASMAFHMVLMIVLALIMGTIHVVQTIGTAPEFDAAEQLDFEPELTHFKMGPTPLDPTELSPDTLRMTEIPKVEAEFNDNSPVFEKAGGGRADADSNLGGLGVNINSQLIGPALQGAGGLDPGLGAGLNAGKGGTGSGFGFRGAGQRDAIGSGATKQSERAVGAALHWISRHQNRDGSWSIRYVHNCKGGSCSGPGENFSDTGATALALLPFLVAGQTHMTKGPYQKHIHNGINWLISHQKPTGDLSTGGNQMYGHGLASIALCECYGMSGDPKVQYAAQRAIEFIESGQNRDGGWRYTHGTDDSDLSVYGWQVMALKSAQMAGLKVNPAVLDNCKKYLRSCATGDYKCEFSYAAGGAPTYSMTSVGLLISQYLGARRDDPVVVNGLEYLMDRKPDPELRDVYYWYYATQVLHNVPGKQWDDWNRHTRRILIESQDTEGCAAGSWNPDKPEPDRWGNQGGRLMVTSLCALTLEVYYRYLPLYKLDGADKNKQVRAD